MDLKKYQQIQIAIAIISLAGSAVFFYLLNNSIISSGLYRNFSNGTTPHALIAVNTLAPLNSTTYWQRYNAILQKVNLGNDRTVLLPFVNNYYGLFLQTSIAVATVLIGLYAIVFMDIIKTLNKGLKDKDSKTIKSYSEFLLMALAVLPFPLLIVSISDIYSTLQISQFLTVSINAFLFLSNLTNTTTSVTATVINQASISLFPLTDSQLQYHVTKFIGLLNSVFGVLEWAIGLIAINLFAYWLYIGFNREIINEK